MRLIDADALTKTLEKLWNIHDDQDFCNKDVWRELENAPTIEPEAIEFEWCSRGESPCKEYDQEKHCCHRWTKVIRQTVEEMKAHEPERTAKAEYSNKHGEYLCKACGRVVQIEDAYCCGCGARLEWE